MKLSETNLHKGDIFQLGESVHANYILCIHLYVFTSIIRLFKTLIINKIPKKLCFNSFMKRDWDNIYLLWSDKPIY